ncbi:glycosyltransferase family 4 protein [Candidatus Daviesbacteria bacterium]|nr:glycosyltransferase family 4 protein [Candidatus Daviesbacteria bacterium]
MKIAIYSPYLDTAGGGEKYILTVAETLSEKARVDILLDKHLQLVGPDSIIEKNKILHNIDFSGINFINAPIGSLWSFFERIFFFKKYDFLFYLTDGSIFFSTAKKNVIHFQVPFENTKALGFWGGFKLKSWDLAVYNSYFTKELVEHTWPIKGKVIYPPVNTELFKTLKKKKQIVSVGRFFGFDKGKKQLLLINIFKQLVKDKKITGWSLHLAGGAQESDKKYIDQLKSNAKGFEIYFYPNIPLGKLVKLYGESQIYWHAAGFGEQDPKRFEHFGITTVEAMASGCVPIVINLGGQKEIVENGQSGFLWDNPAELKTVTLKVIKDSQLMLKLSKAAQQKSKTFAKEKFDEQINSLVYGNS